MMTACLFCSTPGLPWWVRLVNPNHVYFAWGIIIGALVLAVLPFLLGYRLGPRIHYRVKNHFKFFVLFSIPLMAAGSWSFGGSLALLMSVPAVILITLLAGTLDWLAGSSLAGWFVLPTAIIGLALYTWIFALIDRPLVKQSKRIFSGMANERQEEKNRP